MLTEEDFDEIHKRMDSKFAILAQAISDLKSNPPQTAEMNCKIFYNGSLDLLESDINEFFEDVGEGLNIVNMKYTFGDEGAGVTLYSVIMIYHESN